jgi:hypothetical protein
MKKETYAIRDTESGNMIESGLTYTEAFELMQSYYDSDKKDGIFVAEFYEIVVEN